MLPLLFSLLLLPLLRMHYLLLGNDFARVKLNKHGAVGVEFLNGHGEAEVVEQEELELEVVEFDEGETADLSEGDQMILFLFWGGE